MKYLILLLFPSVAFGYASSPDFSHVKHIGVTTVISSVTCAAIKDKDESAAALVGVAAAMGIGFMKESGDVQFDKSDMIANGIGAGLGIGLCFAF